MQSVIAKLIDIGKNTKKIFLPNIHFSLDLNVKIELMFGCSKTDTDQTV
jgi:hypothetical protein